MYFKQIKKLVKKYTVHLIIIFFLANTSIALLIFSMAQSGPCMNQTQIDADPRCLYIYQNEVYEMGTRSKPHRGHQCGMNVDSIMPNLHFVGNILSKFNNAKVAPFCNIQNPTSTPTQVPTATPTSTPVPTKTATSIPTATATATTIATTSATTTPTTVATTKTIPTSTPTSTPTQAAQATNTQTQLPTLTPTQTSITYSGNTFGEILGKPAVKRSDPVKQGQTLTESKNFDLTKITKPVTYVSLLGFIGSIILILIF